MLPIIPITDLQQKTRKFVQQVRETRQPIIITQRGRAAAVLSAAEDFEGMLATLEEMSYTDWQEKLERGKRDLDEGKGITLDAYMKKRAKRRRRG
ncbi:MAG: type II toxin-antitoxin system Phd/YefM family antitoxin [Acidobacteria bacterium]|nr:type II toxin-antitoxin system Phd/YefM family antitoxin [Acidobacteriota bacterium]